MACGTPVIATDCPYGPREVLGDGRYGLLVSPTDPQALADAIVHLLGDETARRRFGALGLERAGELSVQRMVRGYEAVFKALAAAQT
jgi:glycosyltransferase involved in cell wall biosynthesis